MQPLGWGAPQAANGVGGTWQPCGMDGVETAQVDPQELSELAARALRVLLGAEHWLPLSCLRLAVLGSTHDSRSKCLLELAVASLCDQGLVLRQGYGPLAALSVPDAALSKAEALAYSEFPDEGQLPLYSSSLAAAQHRGGGGLVAAAHHRPGSCLRIARRLSSPRQFGHRPMAGIEKASARRLGGKRSSGSSEDIMQQMQKKMRMQDGGGGGGGPFGGGGLQAMSP